MTYKLYKYQYELLHKPEYKGVLNVLENIEMPLLPILEDMQREGININQNMLSELYDKYKLKLDEAKDLVTKEIKPYEESIRKYKMEHYNVKLDDPINIGSPAQLSILFFDIIGYKLKSGEKKTGEKELEEINTPLTNAIIEYKKMSKLIDAFLVALPKKVDPVDNKIHTSLNQYGAATR